MSDSPVLPPEPPASPVTLPADSPLAPPAEAAPVPAPPPEASLAPTPPAAPPAPLDEAEDEEEGEEAEEGEDFDAEAAALAASPEEESVGEEAALTAEEEALAEEEARAEAPPPRRIREDGELPHERFDFDAVKVLTRLHQFGHEAYFVGGCVRDLLLERTPKDFDIATSATPNEVRGIFRNCRLIGRRFRLAHVYFKGGKIIEVSTFRANPTELMAEEAAGGEGEGAAAPGEDLLITHDNVFGTAEEDARRRDFTMNGLFYDVVGGRVLDYVNGRRDIDKRQIRTIGDPEVRMREDPVRILRAVRFAAKLGLDIESRTYAAMEGAVEDLPRCAPARLLEETFRLIRGGHSETALHLLSALDALRVLLPPLGAYVRERGSEGEQTMRSFARALDRRLQEGAEFDDAFLLAGLLVPVSRTEPPTEGEGRPSVAQAIETLLDELVQTARLPRRIAERCRMLLITQRTLTGERRRRGSQASFRRHPLFEDGLALLDVTSEATGEYQDELETWRSGSAPSARPEAEGPRKRRRRRRGGGGGGRGRGAGEGGGPDAGTGTSGA